MTSSRPRAGSRARCRPLLLLALLAAAPACRNVTRSSILGPAEPTAPVGQLVRIPTRPKVFVSYLLLAESPRPPPKAVAVLLPGAGGLIHIGRLPGVATPTSSADLLVRSRERFLSRDLAVAVVDAPSDRPNGMDDAFRAGEPHARDIEAVIQSLRQRFADARLYLVGSDRGALSAAHLSLRLETLLDGVVLVSAPYRANVTGPGLTGFDFAKIPVPLLVVHHVADECSASPYEDALALAQRFAFEAITGTTRPDSGPCDPLSPHGSYGREEATARAIRSWILGGKDPGPSVPPPQQPDP